jgi:hypothetical protein
VQAKKDYEVMQKQMELETMRKNEKKLKGNA